MDPSFVDAITNNLFGYGGLGLVTAYFIVKDYKVTKEMNDTLTDFRAVLEVIKDRLVIRGGGENG